MKVFEHVTDFDAPLHAIQGLAMRPGGFLRFSPAVQMRVTQGSPDELTIGHTFRVEASPPMLPFLKIGQTMRVVHFDDHTMVMDQVEGPLKAYRHESHLSPGPNGTRMVDRITYEGLATSAGIQKQLERQFRFRERQMKGDLAIHRLLAGRTRRILIAGASGLIGTQLAALFANAGQSVGRLVRRPDESYAVGTPVPWSPGSPLHPSVLDGVDAVINLAGHSIGGRFSEENRRAILRSRLDSTGTLAAAVAAHPQTALIQASAIGIYGARRPGELLTETSTDGDGFLADVVRQWEDAARPAAQAGARVAFLRTGIALSQAGGALKPQLPLFLLGLGGRMAKASAMTSWVGVDDVARAYAHAVGTALHGPYNLVGPKPVTQQEFAAAIGKVLKRPVWLPVPSFGPKALLGSEGHDQLIDTDQNVSSAKLEASGFRFHEPTVEEALAHTLTR